jgi:hypothetical protein
MTATQVAPTDLPSLDTPPTCQVIDVVTDIPCGRLAAWLIRTRCPACGLREREFACAPCVTEHLNGVELECVRCGFDLILVAAEPVKH